MKYSPVILIVEDDKTIRSFVRIALESQDYKCIEAENAHSGLAFVYAHNPDVILLDLGLHDMDGMEFLNIVRGQITAPIIIISARGKEMDKVVALDAGADDYLTKPFSVVELLARIRVSLRNRSRKLNIEDTANLEKNYAVGDLNIDFDRHRVTLGGNEIHFTPLEFKLMALLAKESGKVLTHRTILKAVWGVYTDADTQSLRVFMANIRRKIESNSSQPRYLLTEVGVGYRLADE